MWLKEEEEVLKTAFSLTVDSAPPRLEEADAFLQAATHPHLFVGRRKKDVVDKCRTILRQMKKGSSQV